MTETVNKQGIRRYALVAVVILVVCIAAAGGTLVVRDRNEKEMLSQLERSQSDLRVLGGGDREHQGREPHLDERLHRRIRAD